MPGDRSTLQTCLLIYSVSQLSTSVVAAVVAAVWRCGEAWLLWLRLRRPHLAELAGGKLSTSRRVLPSQPPGPRRRENTPRPRVFRNLRDRGCRGPAARICLCRGWLEAGNVAVTIVGRLDRWQGGGRADQGRSWCCHCCRGRKQPDTSN